jgi:cytochrome b561
MTAAYRPTARALHWITAVLVLCTFPAGVVMLQKGLNSQLRDALFIFHKNVGVVILLLVALRLIYRVASPPPPLPESVPAWQRSAAFATHALMYLLLIVMAVSGYIRVKAGGFPLEGLDALGVPALVAKDEAIARTAQAVHGTVRFALFALILIHIAAAAWHGIVRRDGVFSRMWAGR